jgi:glycosyltransferase involved in cell wall biosynthesis
MSSVAHAREADAHAHAAARTAAIFRLQLFKTSETFIQAQAGRLRRYKPVFVGRKLFSPAPEGVEVVTPPGDRLTQARLVLARDVSSLAQALDARRPDVVHAHFAVDGVYAMRLARRIQRPLVVTIHGFDVNLTDHALIASRRPALINYRLFRRDLQTSGATFLCVSDFIRRQALARGFPEERTGLHYLGIDIEKLTPGPEPEQAGLIVQVGRLVEKKGVRYAIDALARLSALGREAELVIVGEGPLRSELEAHAQAAGVAGRVSFLGAQPHAKTVEWMRRAAVILAPSVTAGTGDAEGLPTVVMEAAALGKPVVACDNGGTAEAVIDSATGFVVPERDVEGLARRLEQLLSDQDARTAMGRAARAHVEASFDMRSQTRLLETIYDRVTHER